MITNKNEAKTMVKHISYYCKFNNTKCNSNHKLNNETWQCECKNYKCKEEVQLQWTPSILKEFNISQTKNYCITINIHKISSIHQFIKDTEF